ncbi:hypothetical protein AK830_g2313 [Neonectria ditissima]|uniref:Uncharacterized protein n=1 Tax=Neonectria ditissima TaxID=78410 RepID=A0A0P7BBH3_9HYPO|nr:hypothetical protein AK830_g2313 [Neonectria ditissima]
MASVISKLHIGRTRTKTREPGKIDNSNFGKLRDKLSFGRQSHRQDDDLPSQDFIKTTPDESRPDDYDVHTGTPIANEFARPRTSEEFPIQKTSESNAQEGQYEAVGVSNGVSNGIKHHQDAAPAIRVLQAQVYQDKSDSPATSRYKPMFQNPSDMFRNPEAAIANKTPSPEPESDGPAAELPDNEARVELAAVSPPLSEPVEAPTSPISAPIKRKSVQQPAELSSTPRPRNASIASRGNGAEPPVGLNHTSRPGSRQYVPYSPDAQHDVNPPVSMALQSARAVYNPKTTPSAPEPARHDVRTPYLDSVRHNIRTPPHLDPVQADQGNLDIDFSHPESDGEPAQEEPRQQRSFPLAPRKRDSQDLKPSQLQKPSQPQKPSPQATNIDESDFSDQRRLDEFLRMHNVPENPRFHRLATLFVWMETKLAEEKQRDSELIEQAGALDIYQRDNVELKRKISSIQASDTSRVKLQKHQKQQLEQANATIASLQRDLQIKTQTATSLQNTVNDITNERDKVEQEREQAEEKQNHAEQAYRQLLEAKQDIERQWVDFHQNEMSRVEQEYAGQMEIFRDHMEQEKVTLKAQLEQKRLALKSQMDQERGAFRDQIQKDRLEFQSRVEALSRDHKHEIEIKEREISDTVARHGAASREMIEQHEAASRDMVASHKAAIQALQSTHKNDMEILERNLRELRRRMASYSNTGSYTAISDDDFRNRFQKLTRGINNLIKLVPRPQTYALAEHLDPNGFFARNAQQGGRNWPKFVRSVCWRSILRGFYSRQLGFGALGSSGEGFEELDQLRRLFTVPDPSDPSGVRVMFPDTKELNTWRASFFDALAKTVANGAADQTDSKYTRLFHANIQAVTQDIVSSLQQVANTHLDPRIWDEVASFVQGLGTLALEMGSQRAHVYMETCEHGESVAVGDRFRDDADLGYDTLQVDLMTQPCLTRVGDGREDLQTARTIVKGDFVALKPGQF